mgnify:CR=1 FL=1
MKLKDKLKRIVFFRKAYSIFLRAYLNIIYPLNCLKFKRLNKVNRIMFYSDDETIDNIIKNKKSLSRFGDGEFNLMNDINYNIPFQNNSKLLQRRLKNIIKNNNSNLLVGIPQTMSLNYLSILKKRSKIWWVNYYRKMYNLIVNYLDLKKIYSNSLISRFYIAANNKEESIYRINRIKEIWNDKDIIVVEGNGTKMGVGNDLFDNAKSIKRIICPSKNAFDKYDDILDCVKKYWRNKLTLIALGPTASILAYDMAKLNGNGKIIYQGVDLGHLDIEYEWLLQDAKEKVAVKGKNVNEVVNSEHDDFSELMPKEYLDQIIIEIK